MSDDAAAPDTHVNARADEWEKAHAAWEASAARALKGAALATLVRHTDDGLVRGPLMTIRNRPRAADADAAIRTPHPGQAGLAWRWDVRADIAHGDAALANALILEALEGGATSVELTLDPGGNQGAAVARLSDVARALKGVVLTIAPVSLAVSADADFRDAAAAAALVSAQLTQNAAPDAPPRAALNLDPLGVLARAGASARGPAADLADAGAWAAWAEASPLDATALRADGRVAHDAGGTEAQELAWTLACAAAYARAGCAAGLTADQALGQITLAVTADTDVHLTIAKLRALRRLWARLCAAFSAATPARVHAFAAWRMLTRDDPWTNIIRTSVAGFAAAVGGADVITLPAWTEAGRDRWGPPTAEARRIARNQQLILQDEAHLARVADPAAGAFHHEAVTDGLARAAWRGFQEIERAGGAVAALASGGLQTDIATTAARRAARIAQGAQPIIGVTLHRDADPRPVPRHPAPTPAPSAAPSAPGATGAAPPASSAPEVLIPMALEGAAWAALRPSDGARTEVAALAARRLAEPHEPVARPEDRDG